MKLKLIDKLGENIDLPCAIYIDTQKRKFLLEKENFIHEISNSA
jgi:hypothetical protein